MKLLKIITLTLYVLSIFSCKNKNTEKNITSEDIFKNNYSRENSPKNETKIEMIYSLEYYKNEIIKYEDNYYGFQNISMEITQFMNISSIIKIDNLISDALTFFVCWLNQKGYVYWLYSFNDEHKITKHYYCGDFNPFENYKILMKKISGTIFDYGCISVDDFNHDGKNEIALYSFYKNIGNAFCVYGFNNIENELEILCLVPVFINYDNPFPSVEYIGNGFKILEIIGEEYIELSWNNYIWNTETGKYTLESVIK
jgi:hypothetical protein